MPEIVESITGRASARLELVRAQLERYERRSPALVALAAAASLARLVEPELLRALRLGLGPMISGVRVTVGAESAVWFSSLVENRGPEAITFLPAALQILRPRLAAQEELLERSRAIIEKCHRDAPEVLRWEERMIYFSLTGKEHLLEAEVFRGVRSISGGTRLSLVNWITDMWVRLPARARANAQVARLTQVAEGMTFRPLPASQETNTSERKVMIDFSRIPTREIGLAVRNGRMFFGNLSFAEYGVRVPNFDPTEIEILTLDGAVRETITVPSDGFTGIPVAYEPVRFRTASGQIYQVSPRVLKPKRGYKKVAVLHSKRSARLVNRVLQALDEAAYHCRSFAVESVPSDNFYMLLERSEILLVFFDPRNRQVMDQTVRGIFLNMPEKTRRPFTLLASIGPEASPSYLPPGAVVVELGRRSPAQAAAQILASLPLDESEPETTPDTLPPLDVFIGREAETEQILRAVGPDSPTWGVTIVGPAGIGKTALAIHAARSCPPEWFERVLFVAAEHGYLAELERCLDLPVIDRLSTQGRRQRLRASLRTRRILFIIDDPDFLSTEGLQELAAFLDQIGLTGCKAIVTTRRQIRSSAVEIVLGGLNLQETGTLFDEIARADPTRTGISDSQRTALYNAAHGIPRALRQLADVLRASDGRSFDDIVNRFNLERDRDRSWQSTFRERTSDLSEEAIMVLCLLAHFVSPVTAVHLERVHSIGMSSMEEVLQTLATRSLIVRDPTDRFSLVENASEYLREQRSQPFGYAGDLLQRYMFFLLVDNGSKNYGRYGVLDEQWVIVEASLSGFLAGPNDRLQAVCDNLNYFLDYTGRWDSSIALSRPAELKALEANDLLQAGWRATDTGWIHLRRRQASELESCARRALAHFRRVHAGERAIGWAIRSRAAAYEFVGDHLAARGGYREALTLWRSSGVSGDIAVALNDLARVEQLTGNLDAAEAYCRDALGIAMKVKDLERRTETLGNLASLAIQRGDWQTARSFAEQSLEMAQQLGRLELIAFGHQRMAEAALADDSGTALLHAQRALEIFDRLASPYGEKLRQLLQESNHLLP